MNNFAVVKEALIKLGLRHYDVECFDNPDYISLHDHKCYIDPMDTYVKIDMRSNRYLGPGKISIVYYSDPEFLDKLKAIIWDGCEPN